MMKRLSILLILSILLVACQEEEDPHEVETKIVEVMQTEQGKVTATATSTLLVETLIAQGVQTELAKSTATPTPTNTPEPSATSTLLLETLIAQGVQTELAKPTSTPTSTDTSTPTATFTPTDTATATLTPSNTAIPSDTPTATLTMTATSTFTSSPTQTSTSTFTPTFTFTPAPVGYITAFNAAKLTQRWKISAPYSFPYIAISPDNTRVAVAGIGIGVMTIFDLTSGNQVIYVQDERNDVIESLAWSPDSQYVVTGGWASHLMVWDARSGRPYYALEGHRGNVLAVAWSPDGKLIASASSDETVRIWEFDTGAERSVFEEVTNTPVGLMWSADSTRLRLMDEPSTIFTWNVTSGEQISEIPPEDYYYIWKFDASMDGNYIVAGDLLGDFFVHDIAAGHNTLKFPYSDVTFPVWSPDNSLLVVGSSDGLLRVLNPATSEYIFETDLQDSVYDVDWSSDGKTIVVITEDDIMAWGLPQQ
jgi:hypothetical protein